MAETTITSTKIVTPTVTNDPRFIAGRKLVERGMAGEGAVEIFATLLEDCTSKHGPSSIETVPAYYEYGNALLRASLRRNQQDEQQEEQEEEEEEEDQDARRKALAAAAEQRMKPTSSSNAVAESNNNSNEEDQDKKPAAVDKTSNETNNDENQEDDNDDDNNDDDDITLALEMMENAFSILEDYRDTDNENDETKKYSKWVENQIPRILLGIGDVLSALGRHPDAADAYSRSLEIRQTMLQEFDKDDNTIEHLIAHRKVVEATILIAEELLSCPSDEDVIATETQSLIVKAQDRISYVGGYYDKARDALQEAVFCMGNLAARNVELGQEKEDVCFLATLVMGVGESLASLEDQEKGETAETEPVKKKAKH
jgi:hypothetical protein